MVRRTIAGQGLMDILNIVVQVRASRVSGAALPAKHFLMEAIEHVGKGRGRTKNFKWKCAEGRCGGCFFITLHMMAKMGL